MRESSVGELGYEIHLGNEHSVSVYNKIINIGSKYGLREAGFRAFYSLCCEKGIHQWGYDLRSDDTPAESNLQFVCRSDGAYKGKNTIDKQQREGVYKRLSYFTLNEDIPIWGLEGVYRDGEAVGHIRRADFGHFINKSIGKAYIRRTDGIPVNNEYLLEGSYEIDVLGKLYPAKLHLDSPFDKSNQRMLGFYNEIPENI